MEPKYIINITYQQAFADAETRQTEVVANIASYSYKAAQDAKKAYNTLLKRGFLEYQTNVGMIAFKIISIELVEVEKYNQEKAKQAEDIQEPAEKIIEEELKIDE